MTAICGYNNGDFNSPVACNSGFGCVEWQYPGVFGCTGGSNTILPTTCVEVGDQSPSSNVGTIAWWVGNRLLREADGSDENFRSYSDAPYCATISLYWSDNFYTHWECKTRIVEEVTILATPTTTGHGEISTQYLDAAFSAPGPPSATASPSGGSGDNGGSSKGSGSNNSNIGIIIGAVTGSIGSIAAVGLWICTKHHFWRQRQHEIARDQNIGNHRDLVVRRNGDLMRAAGDIEHGRPVNIYVNELHYHDHAGRRGALSLNG